MFDQSNLLYGLIADEANEVQINSRDVARHFDD